jgi:hypothetical protein
MNILKIIAPAMSVSMMGCTTGYVAKDYAQYLKNNEGNADLPSTALRATYRITKETQTHRYEFRSMPAWVIEFGLILDEALRSSEHSLVWRGSIQVLREKGSLSSTSRTTSTGVVERTCQ